MEKQENTEEVLEEVQKEPSKFAQAMDRNKFWILLALIIISTGASIGICLSHNSGAEQLSRDVQMLKSQVANMNAELSQKFEEGNKVYVFSMEETILAMGMLDKKRLFEQRVNRLNDEVRAAEKKLNSIKDKSVRSEYSEVYMKSLQIKRNNLITDYEKEMTDLTNRINKALEDVVSERNLPVVLTAKDIAVTTQNVVDITKDVIAKLQEPVTATEEQPQEELQK
jgi:hypothetical protein